LLRNGIAELADFTLLHKEQPDKYYLQKNPGPYMAPEMIVGNEVSPRSDLFSLAASFVHLRQGSLPFPGDLSFTIMKGIVEDAPSLSSDVIGKTEMVVLHKALAKLPANRFHTCVEFVTALAAAAAPDEGKSVRPN
jgi:serine/threonine-protein kinase